MAKVTQFLREVKTEMQKVVWPSRSEALKTTGIVIAYSVFVALFLGLMDFGIQQALELLIDLA